MTASAVLVISIADALVIRACVVVGLTILVWPALIAVLLLLVALALARLALRPRENFEPPEMPWYAAGDESPGARTEALRAPGPYVPGA